MMTLHWVPKASTCAPLLLLFLLRRRCRHHHHHHLHPSACFRKDQKKWSKGASWYARLVVDVEHFRSSFLSTSHFLPVYLPVCLPVCLPFQLVAQRKKNLASGPSGPPAIADGTVCTVYLVPTFFFLSSCPLRVLCLFCSVFISAWRLMFDGRRWSTACKRGVCGGGISWIMKCDSAPLGWFGSQWSLTGKT